MAVSYCYSISYGSSPGHGLRPDDATAGSIRGLRCIGHPTSPVFPGKTQGQQWLLFERGHGRLVVPLSATQSPSKLLDIRC